MGTHIAYINFVWQLLHWLLEIWYVGTYLGVGTCPGYYGINDDYLTAGNFHQDMVIFTTLVKILSLENYYNTMGLVKILSHENFRLSGIIMPCVYMYTHLVCVLWSVSALAACCALNCASSLENIPPAYTGSGLLMLLLPVELLPAPAAVPLPLELVEDDDSGVLNFDIKWAILRSSKIYEKRILDCG